MADVTLTKAEEWAVNRFIRMHEMAFDGRPESMVIPHNVMRNYLVVLAAVRARRTTQNGGAITISLTSKWLNQFPPAQWKDIVTQIFSNAAEFGWDIRMEGSKWPR